MNSLGLLVLQNFAEFSKKGFREPNGTFCTTYWPREKLSLLLLTLWSGSLHKSSTRKNASNRVIVSQIARF